MASAWHETSNLIIHMDWTGQGVVADLPKWNKTTTHPPASGTKTDKTVLTVVVLPLFSWRFFDMLLQWHPQIDIWYYVFYLTHPLPSYQNLR